MMARSSDMPADVMEQGAIFDEFAFGGAHLMQAAQFVEKFHADLGHLLAVALVPVRPAGEVDDAAPSRIGKLTPNRQVGQMARKIVEENSLPQGRWTNF